MNSLIHLIYSSAATHEFTDEELIELLRKARLTNESLGITGMLLYTEGSFFQVLEGDSDAVTQLFQRISQDPRHSQVVTIIQEPIARRSFGDWSMGYTNITSQEVGKIVGLNDFFMQASCFGQIDQGRAKKLLAAFKDGRWRTKLRNASRVAVMSDCQPSMLIASMNAPKVSFAYQPIIDANMLSVVSFEAMVRGLNNESAEHVLSQLSANHLSRFDSDCRVIAIGMASRLGLKCNLSLDFLALNVDDARFAIRETLEAATHNKLDASRIILEIDQDKLEDDSSRFACLIEEYRRVGLQVAIDYFGSGRAGLNLLEPYRPDMIALDQNLVRGIDTNGPRQAIVRGIVQTCEDLGIDLIAKHIATLDEYLWFREEGVYLFQGDLFARPGFEQLPQATYPTEEIQFR